VILKSLAKSPEDRFATAGEMVKALQAAIPEMAPSSPPEAAPLAAPGAEAGATVELPLVAARQAAIARPLWQPVLLTAVGWVIAILIGLVFSSIHLVLGGASAGAIGGLSIGLAWRRIEPSASRKWLLTLVAIWALAMAVAMLLGPLFFVMAGIAGWLTGWVMRRVQPKLTRRQMAFMALGWGLGWLLGGILFTLATQVPVKPLSGLLVVFAVLLGGATGGGVMFTQYRQLKEQEVLARFDRPAARKAE
jgi:hypothetical protein